MSVRTIWKFPLPRTVNEVIAAPGLRQPHYIAVQNNVPCMWAEVEPGAPTNRFRITVVGTGTDVPDDGTYIGSEMSGPFVFHYYATALS